MANLIVAQLLYLDSADKKRDITMYVNSPGGSVTAGRTPYSMFPPAEVCRSMPLLCVPALPLQQCDMQACCPNSKYLETLES